MAGVGGTLHAQHGIDAAHRRFLRARPGRDEVINATIDGSLVARHPWERILDESRQRAADIAGRDEGSADRRGRCDNAAGDEEISARDELFHSFIKRVGWRAAKALRLSDLD